MKAFKLSNTRLLYKKIKLSSDWIGDLSQIDLFMEEHPRLQKASDDFHLYFFSPSEKISMGDEVWLAREVVGFLSSSEQTSLQTYDLSQGTYFGEEYLLGQQLALSELLEREASLRSASKRELADTWRLSFTLIEKEYRQRIGLFLA